MPSQAGSLARGYTHCNRPFCCVKILGGTGVTPDPGLWPKTDFCMLYGLCHTLDLPILQVELPWVAA